MDARAAAGWRSAPASTRMRSARPTRCGSPPASRPCRPATRIRSPARSITISWKAAGWCAPSHATSTSAIRGRCTKGTRRRRGRSRCIPITSTKATNGAWRSTSTPASAATPASSAASRRTTFRSSAKIRSCAGARCTGCASTRTTADGRTTRRRTSSRCRACSARTRRVRWCVRWAPPRTATRD